MHVYEASDLKWKEHGEDSGPWFNHVRNLPLRRCGEAVNKFVKWNVFKYSVFVVLIANFIFKAVASSILDKQNKQTRNEVEERMKLGEVVFLGFYIFETAMKIFGLGPKKYIR